VFIFIILARLHYVFISTPIYAYSWTVKIIFIIALSILSLIFYSASCLNNYGDGKYQSTFEIFAAIYYIGDMVFSLFALFLFNRKLLQLIDDRLAIEKQQSKRNIEEGSKKND